MVELAPAGSAPGDVARLFRDQARTHLRDDFLPRIRRCLEVLSEEDVWRRVNENTNSVGNLVIHLGGNIRQWILAGLGGAPDDRKRDAEFSERGSIPKADLAARLTETVERVAETIDALDNATLLAKRRIQIYDVTGLQAIFHVVEHFSYHTGQIVYITRMIRNIDLRFYDL